MERSLGKCDLNVADLWSAALQKQDLLEVLEEAEKEENKEGAAKEAANSAKLPEAEENYWMQGLSEALGADASSGDSKKRAAPAGTDEKNLKRETLSQHKSKAKAKAEGKAKAEPKAKPEPKAKNDAKSKSGMGLAASFAKGADEKSSGPPTKKAKK